MRDPRRTKRWAKRRAIAAMTLPQPCPYCGELVQPDDDWHLAHEVDVVHGGTDLSPARPAHGPCNVRAGHNLRRPRNAEPSRQW